MTYLRGERPAGTGKIIGFGVVHETATRKDPAAAQMALGVKGGLLYGAVVAASAGETFSGKGTGALKAADGTLAGKSVTGNKTAVTIICSQAAGSLQQAGRPAQPGRRALRTVAAELRGKVRQLSGRRASGQEEQATARTAFRPWPLS